MHKSRDINLVVWNTFSTVYKYIKLHYLNLFYTTIEKSEGFGIRKYVKQTKGLGAFPWAFGFQQDPQSCMD